MIFACEEDRETFEVAIWERDVLRAKLAIAKLQLAEQEQRNQDLLGIRNTLQAKLDASERAAAAMRSCIEPMLRAEEPSAELRREMYKATSSDAGRDYVPRSEVEAAWRKGMTDAVGVVNGTFLGYNSQDGADMDFKAQAMTNIESARDAKPTSAPPRLQQGQDSQHEHPPR